MEDNPQNIKILVVDDRQENLVAMRQVLKKVNAEIITVDSGEKALSEVLKNKFALILLDVQMPGMDGFETAELLHRNKTTASIPIIFVTAINKDFKYVTKGYQSGAVDYLSKPIVTEILLGKVQVFINLAENKNELENLNNSLNVLHKRQKLLLESAQEGIIGLDKIGLVTFINPTACKILNGSNDSFINTHISKYLFDSAADKLEKLWLKSDLYKKCFVAKGTFSCTDIMVKTDKKAFPAEYNIAALLNEQNILEGAVLVFQDITKRKQMEDQLLHMAKYDALTGLANRILFKEFLNASMARSKRRKKSTAVVFLDLDDFKGINDTLGHDAGDALLQNVANKINKCIRQGDLAARLGGDEFAIILDDISKPGDTILIAEKILKELREPHNLNGEQRTVGVSIGIASNDFTKEQTSEDIIKKADLAMYDAKRKGKNTYCLYSEKSN